MQFKTAKSVMERGTGELWLAASEDIQQRAATLLKNVHYVIEAEFEMTDKASPTNNPGKFQEITKRRLRKGQFYSALFWMQRVSGALPALRDTTAGAGLLAGRKRFGLYAL